MEQPDNFGFGAEEDLLRNEARKFFKKNSDELTVMKRVASRHDPYRPPECLWDQESWKKISELGWTTLAVPEECGGLGMKAIAVAALVEEAGRAAYPSPLLANINATYVLSRCDTTAAKAFLSQIAEGRIATLAVTNAKGSWKSADTDVKATSSGSKSKQAIKLNGTAWFVQDVRKADLLIVSAKSKAGVGLYAVPVDRAGVEIVPDSIVDLTRDQGHVIFSGVELDAAYVVAEPGRGDQALDAAKPAILTMVAADMCGAGEWQLQTTADYARQRVQFGKPIGSFQAIKHPIVNMMLMVDAARSLVYNAACAIDYEPDKALEYARMAKASAGDMAIFCSGRSIQCHGGIGFTWECFVQLYVKRQIHNKVLYGDAAYHRAKLAEIYFK